MDCLHQVRSEKMRGLVLLGALLISLAIYASAAPTDDVVGSEGPCDSPEPDTDHYRKETLDTVSRNTTQDTLKTNTKSKEKVKVKHLKNGLTETIIVDNTRTKTKKKSITDEYNQTNHTLNVDGLEDDTSCTNEHKHETKETDVVKKKDREVIITDKYGNVVSDTKKEKVKEKTKKKEKDHQTSHMLHTVKHVDPPAEDCQAPPVDPAPDC